MTANKSRRKRRVLVVDDDENLCRLMTYNLKKWGYDVIEAEDGVSMHRCLNEHEVDVILLDVRLPDGEGIDFLPVVKEVLPEVEIIMITAHGTIEMAMEAVRRGAFDFQPKPIDLDRLEVSVRNAAKMVRARRENEILKQVVDGRNRMGMIVGVSTPMQAVYEIIRNVAASNASVIITGETGTGKELVAREIHEQSRRNKRPIITVNCASIPGDLLESEMFGHEKGAFTGAQQQRLGSAERAHQSTLFLDEIGEMPLALQAKMLRFLQDRKFTRVGGSKEIEVDVRIVSATNRDPAEAVREGLLREDLLYRINVVKIHLPALRDRREDIPLLADAFLAEEAKANEKNFEGFAPDALDLLVHYDWPGNVRQLRNVIQETVVLNEGEGLTADMLPAELREAAAGEQVASSETQSGQLPVRPMWRVEKEAMQAAILACRGNVTEAAERLDVSRATLYRKIKEYDLNTEVEEV